MKTFRKISAVLLVIGIVVATFFACTKEKEQVNTQPTDEQITRKPIATYNKSTGIMTYSLTPETMQEVLEQSSFLKDDGQYLIESFEITSLNSKDIKDNGILFSLVDTDLEKTYKTFLNYEFLEAVTSNDSVVYYIAEDVASGNFSFTSFYKDGAYTLTLENFQVVDVEAIPDSLLSYTPRPKKTVRCDSQGCYAGGCDIYYDGYGNPQGCTPCGPPPSEFVWCHQSISGGDGGGNGAAWLGIALTIFFGVLPYLLL